MKKLITLFVCMLSTLIFFQIYQLSLQKEFIELVNFPITLQNKIEKKELTTIQSPIINDEDKSEFIDLFSKFLKETKTTGIIVGYQQKDGQNTISDFYVYSANDSIKQKLNGIVPNIKLNSISEKKYVTTSTSSNPNSSVISLLNPSTFSDTGYQVSIRPFFQIYEDQGYKFTSNYLAFIPSNDKQLTFNRFTAFLSKHNSQFKNKISLMEFASDWEKVYDNELGLILYYIIIISVIILILFTTFIIKQSKQIFVMKLQGISNYNILKHLYLPLLLKCNLTYSATQVILFLVIVGNFDVVTYPLLILLLKQFIIFVSLTLAIFSITYFYLKLLFKAKNYLFQSNLSQIYKMNFILKIAITILTITPFITTWNENSPYIKGSIVMKQNKEKISDYYKMTNVFEYRTKVIEKFIKVGELVDFNLYEVYMNDLEVDKPGDFPYIYVNNNYIKNYTLIGEKGNIINSSDLENGDLLVPVGTEAFNKNYFCNNMRCNIIYYTNKVTFLNYVPTSIVHTVDNPVIQFFSEYDPAFQIDENSIYLSKSRSQKFYKSEFAKITDKTILSLQDNKYGYNDYEKSRNQAISKILLTAFITLFIYLSFVYQSVFVFLNDQQKKLAIQYIQGYSKWQRYSILYLSNGFALLIASIISILLLKLSFVNVIQYIFVLIIIESCQISLLIHRFHNRSISQILKGDQL